MHKTIWTIVKKEFNRFIKDRRMIFTVILLPALLMYGLYTLMGKSLTDAYTVDEDYTFQCYVQNAPESYEAFFDAMNFSVMETDDVEAAKDSVANKEADLVVLFPADFDRQVFAATKSETVPNIEVYYNYDSTTSNLAYDLFLDATEQLETSIFNVLDVNRGVENSDLSTGSSMLLAFLPAIVISMLFASCAALAPESIAGEKERGTFATLLVTPISRTAIAVSKIISLSFFATLGGVSSFIGMLLGMRNMIPEELGGFMPSYSVSEYAWLLLLIVSTVLMTISMISVVSALSKSVKEATSYSSVIIAMSMMGSMLVQFPISFNSFAWRCVPILGTALGLKDLFAMEYAASDMLITCGANVVFMVVMVYVLSKLFNSEKVMFNKA